MIENPSPIYLWTHRIHLWSMSLHQWLISMANVGKKIINPKVLCQRVKYVNHETIASNSWICLAGDVARIRGTHGMNITIFHHFGEYVQATPKHFHPNFLWGKNPLKMAGLIPPWPWNYRFPRNLQGTPFPGPQSSWWWRWFLFRCCQKKNCKQQEMSHHYTWMVDILWYM